MSVVICLRCLHTYTSVWKSSNVRYSLTPLTLIMENEFRHNRMSHNVINHTQGSTRSDHLWQIIKLGALKIDSCQFVKVLCHQPCERQFEGQKTFVFPKVATQTAERHQSLERPTSPTVNITMSVLLCLCNMC